jgi:hypothetical protein
LGENREKTQVKRGKAPGLLSEHIGSTPDGIFLGGANGFLVSGSSFLAFLATDL